MKKRVLIPLIVVASFILVVIGAALSDHLRNGSGFAFIDTDNGKDYYTEGATLGYRAFWERIPRNIMLEHDSCTTICSGSVGSGMAATGQCLIEFYLDAKNYAAFDVVRCEKGCQDGACRK